MPYRDPEKHRAYSREAMRRHRAGMPKPPKPVPEPSRFDLLMMRHELAQPETDRPDWVKAVAAEIAAAGITDAGSTDVENDAQAAAAWKLFQPRYAEARRIERKAKDAERQARRDEEAQREAEHEAWLATVSKQCIICGELPSHNRVVVELGGRKICEHCAHQVSAQADTIRGDGGEGRGIKRCSFCGKVKSEVRLLVGGLDGVNICDRCVAGVVGTFERNGVVVPREPASPVEQPAPPARRKVKRAAHAKAKVRKRGQAKAARKVKRR
jgi:hypothetical protein